MLKETTKKLELNLITIRVDLLNKEIEKIR